MTLKLVSRASSLVHVAAAAWLLLTGRLLSSAPLVIAAQLGAFALVSWAWAVFPRAHFSTQPEPRAPRIVERGPYRLIRHPMYAASETLVWSGVLSHLSPVTLAVGVACTAAVLVRIADEEKLLRERMPGYADYMRRTKRLVPFVF